MAAQVRGSQLLAIDACIPFPNSFASHILIRSHAQEKQAIHSWTNASFAFSTGGDGFIFCTPSHG
jgi:hypothetical protein